MDLSQNQNQFPAADNFRTVPNAAASFDEVPHNAETIGSVRNSAGDFRTVPLTAESRDKYTLSVREVSRMFEAARVARSERSIVNWCQRDVLGAGKLDAYFDPNERKYFITPQSVDSAIAEEKAKAMRHGATAEGFGTVPRDAEGTPKEACGEADAEGKELEAVVMDLRIANRGKDYFIEELRKERAQFADERKELVSQLVEVNRRVGELEMKLLQLEAPKGR